MVANVYQTLSQIQNEIERPHRFESRRIRARPLRNFVQQIHHELLRFLGNDLHPNTITNMVLTTFQPTTGTILPEPRIALTNSNQNNGPPMINLQADTPMDEFNPFAPLDPILPNIAEARQKETEAEIPNLSDKEVEIPSFSDKEVEKFLSWWDNHILTCPLDDHLICSMNDNDF